MQVELSPELRHWRANVGAPVSLDLARAPDAPLVGLDVVSWNVAVGGGRIERLLRVIRDGAFEDLGSDPRRPVVLLIQEAFRCDDSVPAEPASRFHGGARHGCSAEDIVDVARRYDLSLRYAPSMRNGAHASDRGNAILSSVALSSFESYTLPLVRQRRVAVGARLGGSDGLLLVSGHVDVRGQPRDGGAPRFGAGRAAQAMEVARRVGEPANGSCVILGADLNSPLGLRDPAVRVLVSAGLHPARRVGRWRHTFHGPVRLALDHVLYRSPSGRIHDARVVRLDERRSCAAARVFGSDHHPLFARFDFTRPLDVA